MYVSAHHCLTTQPSPAQPRPGLSLPLLLTSLAFAPTALQVGILPFCLLLLCPATQACVGQSASQQVRATAFFCSLSYLQALGPQQLVWPNCRCDRRQVIPGVPIHECFVDQATGNCSTSRRMCVRQIARSTINAHTRSPTGLPLVALLVPGGNHRCQTMASRAFFASWELWQQMTFVLAMGIALVFLIGLMKLWWTNRHMEKIEQLDAEKQERTFQMRRSGLSADTRRSRLDREIPFGVKAIESGAEVDGIWVVRMASMASRPPGRKWTSSRKVSGSVGGFARRETLKPSAQPGKKPKGLPPREAELRPDGSAARGRLQDNIGCEEAGGSAQECVMGQSQPGHAGPLGRLQRSLKKMTSSELWMQQQRKRGGGQEAREFRNNAEARKPQRFYPQGATSAAPRRGIPSHEPVPERKSSLCSISYDNSAEAETSAPTAVRGTQQVRPPTTASQSHGPMRKASWVSSTSSVESFATSVEELKEFAPRSQPPPLEHHPVFSRSDLTAASELTFGRRRSHHLSSAHKGQARQSSSEDGSLMHDQQQHDAAVRSSAATALRYPPNSSRSANYIQQTRPQSFASDQQPRPGGGACFAAQPSPTFGPSDS